MDTKEISRIPHPKGSTQRQMAHLTGTSPKALQTFEQGRRDIPVSSERRPPYRIILNGRTALLDTGR